MSSTSTLTKKFPEPVIHTDPFKDAPKAMIFLVVGVSGVGKSTLVRRITNKEILTRTIPFLCTHTTREPRKKLITGGLELHGVDYYFVSKKQFLELKSKEFFAEWDSHFKASYGTSYNELHRIATEYGIGITDIDVVGADALKKMFPENIHTIFLRPQNKEHAVEQLKSRSQQEGVSEKKLTERLERFDLEMAYEKKADSVVTSISGDPEVAVSMVYQIMYDKMRQVW